MDLRWILCISLYIFREISSLKIYLCFGFRNSVRTVTVTGNSIFLLTCRSIGERVMGKTREQATLRPERSWRERGLLVAWLGPVTLPPLGGPRSHSSPPLPAGQCPLERHCRAAVLVAGDGPCRVCSRPTGCRCSDTGDFQGGLVRGCFSLPALWPFLRH